MGLALEHLRFAGADKLVREIEVETNPPQKPVAPAAPPPVRPPVVRNTQPMAVMSLAEAAAMRRAAVAHATQPGVTPVPEPAPPERTSEPAAHTAARKLQEAVDETQHVEEKRIDLGHKIEGASKTFALHENGFLEINFARSVHVKRGTVSSYSGNLKFIAESGLLGTTAQTLIRAAGQGKIFVYEKGRKTFLLDLNDEFIYVEGRNLLALEDSLTYRVESIYDSAYQRKIDTVKIFGKGSLAISTSIEPLTLRVTREYPLSISSAALVAWTGEVIPTVMDDQSLENVMIAGDDTGFKIRFEGDGVVVSEQ
jgi:uncharacterized protein (AIM24 family)